MLKDSLITESKQIKTLDLRKKSVSKRCINKNITRSSLYDYIYGLGYTGVAAWEAIQFYTYIAPIVVAVNKIADKGKTINPYLQKDDDIKKTHELLDKLKNPNEFQTWQQFFESVFKFYLITNSAYILVEAVTKPQLLYSVPPQSVSIIETEDNLFNSNSYQVQYNSGEIETFHLDQIEEKYFNKDKTKELFPIFGYNAYGRYIGQSVLSSVYYEIEQFLGLNIHNLAMLENGVRISGIAMFKEELNDAQFQRLKNQIQQGKTGKNKFQLWLVDGKGGADYKPITATNKEMEFIELEKSIERQIYNVYKIPLPLVMPERMTLGNFTAAQLGLDRDVVVPDCNFLLDELTKCLLPYYKDLAGYKLSFNEDQFETIAENRLKNLEKKSKLYVMTDNELRTELGLEKTSGGDIVWKPTSSQPANIDNSESKFVDIMESKGYSKEKIIKLYKGQHG